jgi:arsenite transporter
MSKYIENANSLLGQMSILDKFLPIWILIAMFLGFLLGFVEGIHDIFEAVQFGATSLPIAIGLLWMMYPVLAKVKYEELGKLKKEGKLFGTSLFLNWIIGPFLMFFLAWIFLANHPEFRQGIILIGLARCIAMVLIWNMLAGGNNEDAAALVALNSVFQVFMYSIYAFFFLNVASRWFGGEGTEIVISMSEIALSVFIFLGIPLIAGFLTRVYGIKRMGKHNYDTKFAPKLGPSALVGLLFTIVVMFASQGEKILQLKWQLLLIAAPLILYFILMFVISFFISWVLKFTYEKTVSLSFTAASNNFELAIAVAIGAFGIASNQALATVIGPLIEVPILLGLVYFSIWLRKILYKKEIEELEVLAG